MHSDDRELQRALVALTVGGEGVVLAWDGAEVAHEILTLGIHLDEHFAEPPKAPGLWVWEGVVEPPYLPSTVESANEVDSAAVWSGIWRRPTEDELSWFGLYGRNPWQQQVS